jgi:hypothetical protein
MNEHDSSNLIAKTLGKLWSYYKNGAMRNYIAKEFEYEIAEEPQFKFFYFADLMSGSVEGDSFGAEVKRWWKLDDYGLRIFDYDIEFAGETVDGYRSPAVKGEFFLAPEFPYFFDGSRLLYGERFGPHLISRKVANVRIQDETLAISNVKTLWVRRPGVSGWRSP